MWFTTETRLVDALNDATGTTEKFDMSYYHWSEGLQTIDIPYRPMQH